jgi:signal transduction histidine kinase/ActR/RegA family two-component response regulator
VGDSIQALGFLHWGKASASLQDVVARPSSKALPEVAAVPIAADTALSGAQEGRLIQVEGFLREQSMSFGDRILSLESGRTRFTAVLEHPQEFPLLERLRAGALVRLTGVCDIRWDERFTPPNPEEMRLLLRAPPDITVQRDAPWWTLGRALVLMAVLIGVLLLATVWLVMLQRQVRARTGQLRKQMQHREALEEQLRQAQKLEGVGRLAGGVAHDFNNLLTVINGYCELLGMELEEGSDLRSCALEIKKAADRAASLTKQLLAFSRKQILQPVVLDLNLLVTEMDQMLRRLINEDIELITRTAPGPCLIKVDPGQISQVLMNLVVNARDAMPGGGQVIIETGQVVLEASQLALRPDVAPGPYVRMTVTDTGMGMDEETLNQIFEPFFTTKGLGKGTGLGLSTVFGIVKQSGGHIWTYSEPGHGTTFKLFFPAIGEAGTEEPEDWDEITRGGGETLLVVEDQGDVRQMVCRALENQGYRILAAERVEEALAIARRYTGPIHLLLTDVVMPRMNGRELAAQVMELRPGIRVLYMSGYTENVIAHKGTLDPGISFIQKPFSTRDLANRVAETLRKE